MRAALKTILQTLGVVAGLGVFFGGLVVIVLSGEKPAHIPYHGVKLLEDVTFVTSRSWYHYSIFNTETYAKFQERPVELKWLQRGDAGIELARSPPPALATNRPVIILVHGYSAPEQKVASYFEAFLGRLHTAIGKGADIVVYDWPSTARHFEELSIEERRDWIDPGMGTPGKSMASGFPGLRWESHAYTTDVIAARSHGADGFLQLLRVLTAAEAQRHVIVLAHSMGSFVVMEALRKSKGPIGSIDRIVLLAPDVDARSLADPALMAALAAVPRVHVFFSRNDDVLLYSRIKNVGPRLGRDGYVGARPLPGNIVLHDVTGHLGTGEAVHSRYLEADGAEAISLYRVLQ